MNGLGFIIALGLGLAVTIRAQYKCKFPVNLINNRAVLLNRTKMNFKCQKSYYRGSIPLKHCQSEQGSFKSCLAGFNHWTKCGYPGFPSNGYIYVDSMMQLSYACNNGFDLQGEVERRCLINGTWAPIIPKCVQNLAKDIGYPELTDKDSSTYVNLKENTYTQFDFKKEIVFDVLKIRLKNWNENNALSISYSQQFHDNNYQVIIKRDPLPKRDNFQEIEFTAPSELKLARYLSIWPVKPISIYEISIYNSNEETACNKPDEPLHGRIKTITSNLVDFECDWGYTLHGRKSAFCVRGVWQFPTPACNYSPTTPSIITTRPTTQAPRQITSTTTDIWTTFITNPTTRATTRTPATTANTPIEIAYNSPQDKNDEKYDEVDKDTGIVSIKNNDDNDDVSDSTTTDGTLINSANEVDIESEEHNKNITIAWVVAGCLTVIIAAIIATLYWRYHENGKKTNAQIFREEEVPVYEEVREVPIYTNDIPVRSSEDRKAVPVYANDGAKEVSEHEYLDIIA